jgi:hypothetical protein
MPRTSLASTLQTYSYCSKANRKQQIMHSVKLLSLYFVKYYYVYMYREKG